MSTIKRSKTDAFSVKESVNIVKLAEAAFEQISLDQLTDVVVETPTDGDILVYSSDLMAWENVPQAGLNYDLEDLDNITITSVSDGQVLTWDSGTNQWVNETPTTGATTLDGLTDVNTLGVAGGMVLMYNSDTSEWNAESLDYPNSLDDLTDVTISTPSNGQVLKYNGSAWVNGADSGATPGGSDTHVQYNDGGVLGGKSSFTFNETTDTLSIPKVKSSDGLYTLSASTLGFGSARIYDSGDEMGFIADATDNLGLDTRAFRFNTASAAPEFYDGSTYRAVYHEGNFPATPIEIGVACSDETTALTAGAAKTTFRVPKAITLTGVRASLTTAQTSGSTFTVDINASGTSILSTKLTIDNTEKTSTTAATAAVISDTSLADDEEVTVDIDQVGDGTATGLKVWLIGTRT